MGRHKRVVSSIPVIRSPRLINSIKNNETSMILDPAAPQQNLIMRLNDWEDLRSEHETMDCSKSMAEVSLKKPAPLLLMVTARSDPTKLIFPKGGLHKNEVAMTGALRETWEEAGVTGICTETIVQPKDEGSGGTKFWCFEMDILKIYKSWPEEHQRRRVWLDTTNLTKPAIKKLHTKRFAKKALKLWLKKENKK